MLLSYYELRQIVRDGFIENVDESQINGSSIDVTLDCRILIEDNLAYRHTIDYRRRDSLQTVEVIMDETDGFVVKPGQFILAASREIFNLPNWLACQYQLKSSVGRIGLNQASAGWCDPGWHGSKMTLEMKNDLSHQSIRLRPGDRIGQVIFSRCSPVPDDKSYSKVGRYNNDLTVTGIKK
jgi:dCTP deaminase